MAKKRAKKATRRTSKAKRSTARRRRPWYVDPATGQRLIFHPETGTLAPGAVWSGDGRKLSPAEQAERDERERVARLRREEFRARARAAEANRRALGMEFLPRDLQDWLLCGVDIGYQVREVSREHGLELDARACEVLEQWAQDLYLEGCRQGYIEGRLVEIAAKQEVGAGKHQKLRANLVPFDGVKIPMDERDAKIFRELPAMRQRAGTADEGDELMGERVELTGKQVRNIYFEQTVLRERAALVQQGLGAAAAAERVVQKYGLDKHGKPRQAKVRAILKKAPQRTLPEVQGQKVPATKSGEDASLPIFGGWHHFSHFSLGRGRPGNGGRPSNQGKAGGDSQAATDGPGTAPLSHCMGHDAEIVPTANAPQPAELLAF